MVYFYDAQVGKEAVMIRKFLAFFVFITLCGITQAGSICIDSSKNYVVCTMAIKDGDVDFLEELTAKLVATYESAGKEKISEEKLEKIYEILYGEKFDAESAADEP